MPKQKRDEVFFIPARRCERCGGLLTSTQAIADGMGHTCKIKTRKEALAAEEEKQQFHFWDEDLEV